MSAARARVGANSLRMALIGLVLVLASACSTIYRNHGYVPSDAELATVSIGDTRDAVTEKIGRPTAAGLLNDRGWYYVQSRWATRGAFAPRELEREVVAVTFTEGGAVENIERFGLERGKVVPLSRRVTETNVKGMSLIRQLMGSIGRVGPGIMAQD